MLDGLVTAGPYKKKHDLELIFDRVRIAAIATVTDCC
jgi:hypothetical protein